VNQQHISKHWQQLQLHGTLQHYMNRPLHALHN